MVNRTKLSRLILVATLIASIAVPPIDACEPEPTDPTQTGPFPPQIIINPSGCNNGGDGLGNPMGGPNNGPYGGGGYPLSGGPRQRPASVTNNTGSPLTGNRNSGLHGCGTQLPPDIIHVIKSDDVGRDNPLYASKDGVLNYQQTATLSPVVEVPAGETHYFWLKKPPMMISLIEEESCILISNGTFEYKIKIVRLGEPDYLGQPGGLKSPKFSLLNGGCGTTLSNCAGSYIRYKHLRARIRTRQEDTLANRSIYRNNGAAVYINAGGSWYGVNDVTGWETDVFSSTLRAQDGNVPSNEYGYRVTDPAGNRYYYYTSGAGSVGETNYLHKVALLKPDDAYEVITYNYDSGDSTALNSQEDGAGNQLRYEYDDDGCLIKIAVRPTGSGVDVREYNYHYGDDGMLQKAYCMSCDDKYTRLLFADDVDELIDPFDNVKKPEKYYIECIDKVDESGQPAITKNLAEYHYDSDTRLTKYEVWMEDGLKTVSEWSYAGNPATEIIRKDYVDDDNFRAEVYAVSATDYSVTSKKQYHQLQNDDNYPYGLYSETAYSYDEEGDDSLHITTLPNRTQKVQVYDVDNQLSERYMSYGLSELPMGEYSYSLYTDRYMLDEYTNPYGGDEDYEYDASSQKLIRRVSPAPTSGVEVPTTRNESRTNYNDKGQVKYACSLNSDGDWIGVEYVYDDCGKVDQVKSGVAFTVNETTGDISLPVYTDAVVTDYDYDDFGNLIETAKLVGSDKREIKRVYYDDYDRKIGNSSVLTDNVDPTADVLVSASKVTYGHNGKIVIASVVREIGSFDEDDLETDLAIEFSLEGNEVSYSSTPALNWVHTVYEYSDIGWKTAVYTDARLYGVTGDGRVHLQTQYEYNYQGELVMTTRPNGKWTKTERDGRGYVSKQITGYGEGENETEVSYVIHKYDVNGNKTETIEPFKDSAGVDKQTKTIFTYDVFNRLVKNQSNVVIDSILQ